MTIHPCLPKHNRAAYQPIANGRRNLGNTRLAHAQVQAAKNRPVIRTCTVRMALRARNTLRMALQAHSRFRRALSKEVTMSITWDFGASISLSFDHSDFVGVVKTDRLLIRLQGVAKCPSVEGQGHALWQMLDTNGQPRLIMVPAFGVAYRSVTFVC
jgi:hypothetical protein